MTFIKAKWMVIGAGPSGILNIGKLLDNKIKPNEIIWIDPCFNVGRIGKFYKNVPSNTKVKTFIDFLNGCKSFNYDKSSVNFEIKNINPENPCLLDNVIKPLNYITDQLSNKVIVFKDVVENIELRRKNNNHIVELKNYNKKIISENIILSTGCLPKEQYHKDKIQISLDDALDLNRLKNKIETNDIVGVNGTSHSGILILKNLDKLNIKSVISYSKRPLRYAIYKDNKYIYDNTGLKGDTALWAKEIYEKNMFSSKIIKTTNINDLNICNKIIDAIGFERNIIKGLPKELLNKYNDQTGVIDNNLFGSGIAFPKKVLDLSGDYEYDVGLGKFLKHSDEMIKIWINNNNLNRK